MLATGDDELGERIEIALTDPSFEIRREAMGAAGELEPNELLSLVETGVGDPDDFVRDYAFDHARRLPDPMKMDAFRAALVSEFPEMKDKAIRSLANVRTPEAFGYMLEGLKDESAEVRESINRQAEALIERQFVDYEAAQSWWSANKSKFDDSLLLIE
jgi:HEAT repeat protein